MSESKLDAKGWLLRTRGAAGPHPFRPESLPAGAETGPQYCTYRLLLVSTILGGIEWAGTWSVEC